MAILTSKNLGINRKKAVVQEWDEIYCDLLQRILDEGVLKENRTGVDTISIPNVQFIVDVSKSFPILESKKVIVRNALTELLWFYQAQSNDVRWLQKRNNPIWNLWMIDADGIYRLYDPSSDSFDKDKIVVVKDLNGKELDMTAKSIIEGRNIIGAKYFGKEMAYTIGTAYGNIILRYELVQEIIKTLRENPNDRRMIVSLWQNEFLKTAVLPSCVWSHTLNVSNGKLHMCVSQRSCDTPLGLPFNVTQYAILLCMYAKEAGLEPGTIAWNISDCHVYVNQLEGVKQQLEEYKKMKKTETFIQRTADNDINNRYKYLEKMHKLNPNIDEVNEEMDLIKYMVTRENPELELSKDKSFFEYNNIPNCDKSYLEQNPTGNEDIKIKNYTHRRAIKMPLAQ